MSGAARGFFPVVPPHPDRRRLRLAIAVTDAATGARLVEGIEVKASGLEGRAVTNASGFFVLLDEPGRPTGEITVAAPGQPYLPAAPFTPSAGHDRRAALHVALLPSRAYPLRAGVLALRGRVMAGAAPLPAVQVAAEVLLDAPRDVGWSWAALPFDTRTDAAGEFLRLLPLAAEAFVPNGPAPPTARVRMRFTNAAETREGPNLLVAPNDAPTLPDFDWNAT